MRLLEQDNVIVTERWKNAKSRGVGYVSADLSASASYYDPSYHGGVTGAVVGLRIFKPQRNSDESEWVEVRMTADEAERLAERLLNMAKSSREMGKDNQ